MKIHPNNSLKVGSKSVEILILIKNKKQLCKIYKNNAKILIYFRFKKLLTVLSVCYVHLIFFLISEKLIIPYFTVSALTLINQRNIIIKALYYRLVQIILSSKYNWNKSFGQPFLGAHKKLKEKNKINVYVIKLFIYCYIAMIEMV